MSKNRLNITLPPLHLPFLDQDGRLSTYWHSVLLTLYNRTGGLTGIDSAESNSTASSAQNSASAAQLTATRGVNAANAAQSSATIGITAATTAQATADLANAGISALNATAVLKASFQSDGIAPSSNPILSGAILLLGLIHAPNDAAAAASGVALNQVYANGSVLMVRVA